MDRLGTVGLVDCDQRAKCGQPWLVQKQAETAIRDESKLDDMHRQVVSDRFKF